MTIHLSSFGIFLLLSTLCFATPRLPNVVILLADDLGSKDIGCYGGPVKTPALDGLAAKGVRFTDFHAGAPVCSPSRATLITGRQHLRTGVYTVVQDHEHDMHLLEREVTIAEVLKGQGYATAHIGKWHLGAPFRKRNKPAPDQHGFDYYFATDNNAAPSHRNPSNFYRNGKRVGPLEGYACQIVVDDAVRWLADTKKNHPDKPFFLNIWFHEPHAPIAAPDKIVSRYGMLGDPAAIYSGTIDNTDRAIARLLTKIDELDSLDNTLIIYSSDHGSYRPERNGGLRGNKGSNFEGGLRAPGIFCWPGGIPGGRTEDEPSGAVDLLPTICGLLRIDQPPGVHLDGADLSPLLVKRTGTEFTRHQPLFWHSPTGQPHVALRDGRYTLMGYRAGEFPKDQQAIDTLLRKIKVILESDLGREIERSELFARCFNTQFKNVDAEKLRREFVRLSQFQESWIPMIKAGSGGFRKFELYDLSKDPTQQIDLAAKLPEVTARLKEQLLAINAGVLADAPNWGKRGPVSPPRSGERQKFFARIEATPLPAAYAGKTHQQYVDRRMARFSPAQRAQLGNLWKEKQRLDPDMPNRGASFVRILEYVAKREDQKAGKGD